MFHFNNVLKYFSQVFSTFMVAIHALIYFSQLFSTFMAAIHVNPTKYIQRMAFNTFYMPKNFNVYTSINTILWKH